MLTYRSINYEVDLVQIIPLIRKNLDSTYTQSSFRWKHLENPFGKSYGFLALDGEKIIGLRMFMYWEFKNISENTTLRAIRPVDTVVDENHRGKGLFKKLTLQGLNDCKGKYDLIFNTPNENSLPGYLKMGWKNINTNYFKLGLVNILTKNIKIIHSSLEHNLEYIYSNINRWETNKSLDFFKWRYGDSNYLISQFNSSRVIYSLVKTKFFNQLVIHELWGDTQEFKILLESICKKHKTFLIYYYNNDSFQNDLFIKTFVRKKSVVVLKEDITGIESDLNFSLGDLEGKL